MRPAQGLLSKHSFSTLQDSGISDNAVNAGIAGVGFSAPFLGMIGERRITQDPYYNKNIPRMSSKNLESMARPGDILLTSTREGAGFYKHPQVALTGSEFYHAEPVFARNKRRGVITTEAGLYDPIKSPEYAGATPESLVRSQRGTPMSKRVGNKQMYEDAVLLRPKKDLTRKQLAELKRLLAAGGQKAYSEPLAVSAYLGDMFVPKIKGLTDKFVGPGCAGEMCSSLPSGAHQKVTGQPIATGKHTKAVLPADFMRAGSPFEAVGATLQNKERLAHPAKRFAKRLALRGSIGAGIAGAGLLAYNEPEGLGGVAAGVAAPMGAYKLMDHIVYNSPTSSPKGSLRRKLHQALQDKFIKHDLYADDYLPTATRVIPELDEYLTARRAAKAKGLKRVDMPKVPKAVKRFILNRGGLALGAGLGSYGLLKLLTNSLKEDEEQQVAAKE